MRPLPAAPRSTGPPSSEDEGRVRRELGDERFELRAVEERDPATWAACAVAAFCGADAVRVHAVAGALRAVQVGRALREASR